MLKVGLGETSLVSLTWSGWSSGSQFWQTTGGFKEIFCERETDISLHIGRRPSLMSEDSFMLWAEDLAERESQNSVTVPYSNH